jgi:hypothetical protein
MTPKINPNPLARYFRKPTIYIRLPSNGDYWSPDALAMPENGELPVYPMTAADEITMRTPDALFNGQATVDVIQSCLPNIRNAWGMPGIDLYSILISLRVASYGHEMDISTNCPGCNETSDYTIDLRATLESLQRPDYTKTAKIDDLEVIFRPMSYREQTEINLLQFESNRLVESVQASTAAETEKMTQIAVVMRRLSDLQLRTLLMSIAAVKIPDATITAREHIEEYLQKCDRQTFSQLRGFLMTFRGASDPKPMDITCQHCQHAYKQSVEFDQTNFFAQAS